jgi:hypothetical protein
MTKDEILEYYKVTEKFYDDHLYYALNEIPKDHLMPFLICLLVSNDKGIQWNYEMMLKQYNEGVLDRTDLRSKFNIR